MEKKGRTAGMRPADQRKSGVILSYLSEGIQIVSTLLYTPVMLRILGKSEYGLYQLAGSFTAYLGLLSFGFEGAYIRFYSRAREEKDPEETARLNGMFLTVFLGVSLLCALCGGVMTRNLRGILGGGLTEGEYRTAGVLMVLMTAGMTLTFPNMVFRCNAAAHERFVFQRLLTIAQKLLDPFLTLPLLLLGYGSVGMAAVGLLLKIAVLVSNIWFCRKRLRIRFRFRGFRLSLLKEMGTFTFFIFLNQVIDLVNANVDKLLLGRMLGTGPVAVYGLALQIHNMYVGFSVPVAHVFVPEIHRIAVQGKEESGFSRMFIRVGRIQFLVLGLILTGFFFFGKAFMAFWAGEGYGESYDTALWLLFPMTVPLIQNTGPEILRAQNRHKIRSVVYLMIAAVNVLISIPLIRAFGPSGAAAGTAVSLLAGNILFMNWYYWKKIGLDIPGFWKGILKALPVLILPCIFGMVSRFFFPLENFLAFGGCAGIYGAIYVASVWLWGRRFNACQ
ncbi:MAG: oligosaccharide flippase family protein [Oscillospiraceae bacterium]|jgi:O-antigen/teichoic acid export membrane protein|nr:oligosaccharide flippase family protein [Oscillospiraceae bacterium]